MRWSIHEGVTMPDPSNARARAAWRTLTSRPVYANPWIRVREDTAELPDGRTTLYGVVQCAPAVGVLPFVDARTVVLVGQWRYVPRAFRWEIPTGAVKPAESEEAAARRERAGEGGYEAEPVAPDRPLQPSQRRPGPSPRPSSRAGPRPAPPPPPPNQP